MSEHYCEPHIWDYSNNNPPCLHCGAELRRLLHVPGHVIAGRPCLFPDEWRYCFVPAALIESAARDPFQLSDWRPA